MGLVLTADVSYEVLSMFVLKRLPVRRLYVPAVEKDTTLQQHIPVSLTSVLRLGLGVFIMRHGCKFGVAALQNALRSLSCASLLKVNLNGCLNGQSLNYNARRGTAIFNTEAKDYFSKWTKKD